jgi:hypothetical protein
MVIGLARLLMSARCRMDESAQVRATLSQLLMSLPCRAMQFEKSCMSAV